MSQAKVIKGVKGISYLNIFIEDIINLVYYKLQFKLDQGRLPGGL